MKPGIYNMDCLDAIKKIKDNSISSIVTDPPYGISFMGKKWDYDIPSVDIWKQCLRILKPGGYLLSFAGTRTQHRMAINIEDAGFEIRDMIAWVYGSGFPKSLDVGKAIDKRNGRFFDDGFKDYCNKRRKKIGLSLSDINKMMGTAETGGGFASCVMGDKLQNELPTLEMYRKLKKILKMDNRYGNLIETTEAEREITGKDGRGELKENMFFTQNIKKAKEVGKSIGYGKWDKKDKASTFEAKQWDGWGTALKPSLEPITVARKPLDGTVANNILKWGTGGINIDGCRIELNGDYKSKANGRPSQTGLSDNYNSNEANQLDTKGRFPSNLIHDGSEEVEKSFPESDGQQVDISGTEPSEITKDIYGKFKERLASQKRNDSGSASRFFYCAKASKSERDYGLDVFEDKVLAQSNQAIAEQKGGKLNKGKSGMNTAKIRKNNHPTVKPLELIRYLVRLVTPPNGICVDPFVGSGTTGMACKLEGFDFIGMDKEKEYCDISNGRIEAISQVEIDKGELILPEEQNENQIDMFK